MFLSSQLVALKPCFGCHGVATLLLSMSVVGAFCRVMSIWFVYVIVCFGFFVHYFEFFIHLGWTLQLMSHLLSTPFFYL